MTSIDCFKAYDVRGKVPAELNEDVAYRIGCAFAQYEKPKRVVVGRDVRPSGAAIINALAAGFNKFGVEVLDLGLCGTEEIYWATYDLKLDGGLMVTASHNPPEYNGIKMVRSESRPISGDTGLVEIRKLAEKMPSVAMDELKGHTTALDHRHKYISHLLSFVDSAKLKPLKIVTNAGNGGAGDVIDALEPSLPFEFVKVQHEPDGSFPNGVPNPMIIEKRAATADVVIAEGADFGVAWDGDFDRCFLFDEKGQFIEGYYLISLLAKKFLAEEKGSAIIYDPRLTWCTEERVAEYGGRAVMSKAGHAFIKDVMREHDAIYGGEMSAHHYFRDFSYCDSGMIPWLIVAELLSIETTPLSEMVADLQAKYPSSGEINRSVKDVDALMASLIDTYKADAVASYDIDGVSFDFEQWRFNLRASNTEPVVRLNVESRADRKLMQEKTDALLAHIARY